MVLREAERSSGRPAPRAGRPCMGPVPLARIITVAALAIVLGYREAAALIYLREIAGIVSPPGSFTLQAIARIPGWIMAIEQTRQAACLVVVLAVAMLAGRAAWERLAAFLFSLGLWCLTHYAALKLMINWPQSLAAKDLVFITPEPLLSPVWIPLLCALVVCMLGLHCWRVNRRP